ncbi:hypothetical protein PQR53_07830 [Paraburkholderia fungorum]|uniref:hypothetical protein n=1 Tax=Paraburkholderia fungorum TaxID=134537 RepID=UPI0038BBB402
MQAYQLRLPKEHIRDLQILRVMGGVKVAQELRDIVAKYLEEKRPMIQGVAQEIAEGNPEARTTEGFDRFVKNVGDKQNDE